MSDIRSYSTIAEHADPSELAGQLNTHRAAMNRAIIGEGGTVMQFVGDAVMAVFGAPVPRTTTPTGPSPRPPACTRCRTRSTSSGRREGLPVFGLGIGLSTGEVAAALLGSEERLEYTLVGDTVNLSQRLQQLGSAGETVISEPTRAALSREIETVVLDAQLVKGRDTPVVVYKILALDAAQTKFHSSSESEIHHDQHRTDTSRRENPVGAGARGPRRPKDLRGRDSPRCAPCAASTSPSSAARSSP